MKKTHILAIANEKGGVGKTTTAFNLAAGFAEHGKKVLLCSLDKQHNLNDYVGCKLDTNHTISELCYYTVAGMNFNGADAIRKIEDEKIDYIPSSDMLSSVNSILATASDSQGVLKKLFSRQEFSEYEYIILDCKPELDLFVVNALVAATGLIIPVQAEKFSFDGLQGILSTYERIRATSNPQLEIIGILVTMLTKTTMATSVTTALQVKYSDYLFDTKISRAVEAVNSTALKKSLIRMNGKLGQQYKSVTKEVITRCEGGVNNG